MASRDSSSGWGILGILLLLGVVLQVVKLLVVPLTILAVGAVVVVPIYLFTKHGKGKQVDRPRPSVAAPKPEPADDGIVSQDAVLKFLPTDVVTALTQGQPGHDADGHDPSRSAQDPQPVRGTPSDATSAEPWPTAYRHGSCPVKHRTYEAARRCRRG